LIKKFYKIQIVIGDNNMKFKIFLFCLVVYFLLNDGLFAQQNQGMDELKKGYKSVEYTVRANEASELIAQKYYGTYSREVYYELENKKMKLSNLLRKVNGIENRDFQLGEKINLPIIDDIHFKFDINIKNDKEAKEFCDFRSHVAESISDEEIAKKICIRTVDSLKECDECADKECDECRFKPKSESSPKPKSSSDGNSSANQLNSSAVDNRLKTLEEQSQKKLSAFDNRIKALEDSKVSEQISALDDRTKKLEEQTADSEEKSQISERLSTLDNRIKELEDRSQKQLPAFDKVSEQISALDDRTKKIEEQTADSEEKSQISERLSTLDNRIKELEDRSQKQLSAEDSKVSEQISALDDRIKKLEKQSPAPKEESQISEQLSNLDNRISELRSSLNERVKNLEDGKKVATAIRKNSIPDDDYVVREGDTLGDISTIFYGTCRFAKCIQEANKRNIPIIHDISVGMEILIPKPEYCEKNNLRGLR
jgi:hypothetical protein